MYTQSAPLNPSVPHSHASSSRLGLQEIFDWAERMSGIPCKCLRDLQDGAIISSIMRKIFPIAAQNCALSGTVAIGSRYRDDHWSEVSAMTAYLQLPEHLLDYLGVASGSFESSYGVLVSFFFLHGLSQKHDFAVDFAHPIHPPLARFLESNRSVECLIRGGSLVGLQHGLPDAATPPAIGAPVPSSAHTPLPARPLLPPLPPSGTTPSPRRRVVELEEQLARLRSVGNYLRERVTRLEEELARRPPGPASRPFDYVYNYIYIILFIYNIVYIIPAGHW